jgi:pimeloyl-ACP methyl ester carboxylesterase
MSNEILGRYVEVAGARTYYESAGAGDGLLCIHTAGRDCRQWHAFLEHFADRYRVVALDLPGHQKSWPLPGERCIDDADELVDFIWSFIEAIGLRRPVVMGCSIGGNLVYPLAQRHPVDVKALVSLQGSAWSPRAAPHDIIVHPQVSLGQFACDRSLGLLGATASTDVREFVHWTGLQLTQETFQADMAAYADFDVRGEMDQIVCPCFVLRGTDDWIVTQEMVEESVELLTNAAVVEAHYPAGVGHIAHLEAPEVIFELLDPFLANVERAVGANLDRACP